MNLPRAPKRVPAVFYFITLDFTFWLFSARIGTMKEKIELSLKEALTQLFEGGSSGVLTWPKLL